MWYFVTPVWRSSNSFLFSAGLVCLWCFHIVDWNIFSYCYLVTFILFILSHLICFQHQWMIQSISPALSSMVPTIVLGTSKAQASTLSLIFLMGLTVERDIKLMKWNISTFLATAFLSSFTLSALRHFFQSCYRNRSCYIVFQGTQKCLHFCFTQKESHTYRDIRLKWNIFFCPPSSLSIHLLWHHLIFSPLCQQQVLPLNLQDSKGSLLLFVAFNNRNHTQRKLRLLRFFLCEGLFNLHYYQMCISWWIKGKFNNIFKVLSQTIHAMSINQWKGSSSMSSFPFSNNPCHCYQAKELSLHKHFEIIICQNVDPKMMLWINITMLTCWGSEFWKNVDVSHQFESRCDLVFRMNSPCKMLDFFHQKVPNWHPIYSMIEPFWNHWWNCHCFLNCIVIFYSCPNDSRHV